MPIVAKNAILDARAEAAAERLSALLALPLCPDGLTAEEKAIFAEAEADLRAGRRGYTTAEVWAAIEETQHDAAE